jgi:hypothetical protein
LQVFGQTMNRKLLPMLAVLASAIVWSCAGPAEVGTEQKLDESQAAYKRCVALHAADSSSCEAAKRHYQSNEQNAGGIQPDKSLDMPGDTGWTQ